MEFRGQRHGRGRATSALLGHLRLVSLAEFESALPDDFVTAAERACGR